MNIIYLELRPANPKCWYTFTEVAKEQYNGKAIFEHARAYVNSSSGFKRNGRRLEIIEIEQECIKVKLYSEGKLKMASKAMATFTRELLRVDKEMYPDEEYHIFRPYMLNGTLFKYEQILEPLFSLAENNERKDFLCDESKPYSYKVNRLEVEAKPQRDISDVDALKLCVDLFCGNASRLRSDYKTLEEAKKEIKKLLWNVLNTSYEYASVARMMTYYNMLKKEEDK